MGNACPFTIAPSNAATNDWLAMAAIVAIATILILTTLLLSARARVEELEGDNAALLEIRGKRDV